ncbi:MAG: transposase zinc-binding domain-containing protein, partial [Cyanobium sp.]
MRTGGRSFANKHKRRGVCPACGAKRAVKFAEHLFNEVIEDIPHRHTVFTIP